MTGTLRSLRDWLADQLAEVRHATPLTVLSSTQTLTELDRVLMPGWDAEPSCEARDGCDAPATVRVKLHATFDGWHGDGCLLACDGCFELLRQAAEAKFARVAALILLGLTPQCSHPGCGKPVTCIHDLVIMVAKL